MQVSALTQSLQRAEMYQKCKDKSHNQLIMTLCNLFKKTSYAGLQHWMNANYLSWPCLMINL